MSRTRPLDRAVLLSIRRSRPLLAELRGRSFFLWDIEHSILLVSARLHCVYIDWQGNRTDGLLLSTFGVL